MFDHLRYIQENVIKEFTKKLNDAIELEIRNNSTPPIKGEITLGKIRRRGITKIQSDKWYWFEQRGRQISSKYGKPNFTIDPAELESTNYTITAPILPLKK